jgi:hypothetical protein
MFRGEKLENERRVYSWMNWKLNTDMSLPRTLSFNQLLLSHWDTLTEKVQSEVKDTSINGHELDLATIVAVARWVILLLLPTLFIGAGLTKGKTWCFCQSRFEGGPGCG